MKANNTQGNATVQANNKTSSTVNQTKEAANKKKKEQKAVLKEKLHSAISEMRKDL